LIGVSSVYLESILEWIRRCAVGQFQTGFEDVQVSNPAPRAECIEIRSVSQRVAFQRERKIPGRNPAKPSDGPQRGRECQSIIFLPSQQCASSSYLPTSQFRWRLESMDTRCYSRSRLYLGEFDFFFDSQNSCTLERTFDTVRESSQKLPMKLYRRCGDRLRLRFARGQHQGRWVWHVTETACERSFVSFVSQPHSRGRQQSSPAWAGQSKRISGDSRPLQSKQGSPFCSASCRWESTRREDIGLPP